MSQYFPALFKRIHNHIRPNIYKRILCKIVFVDKSLKRKKLIPTRKRMVLYFDGTQNEFEKLL